MDGKQKKVVEFNRLNGFGKAIFIGSAAIKLAAKLIDSGLDHVAGIVADTEKAFKEGRDPNIEEAKILEEHEDPELSD